MKARRIVNSEPKCTVQYDERMGCGINLATRVRRDKTYLELAFVTKRGRGRKHDINGIQAEELLRVLNLLISGGTISKS
jgi:hypothetical protein